MTTTTDKIPDWWIETTLGEITIFNYWKWLTTENRIFWNVPVYWSSGITGYHNIFLVNERGIIIWRKWSVWTIYKSDIPFYPIDTVFYITQNDTKCNLDFLYRLLQYLKLDKKNSDSAVPWLNRENAYSTNILLPPLPEQKVIAQVLSSFDDKIELLKQQNETLEKTAQTIFQEWFGKYSIDDELPEWWKVGKLGEICEIISGKRPENVSDKKTETNQIPLIWASKIMGYVEEYLFDERTLVIGRVWTHGEVQKFNEKIFPSDNTLVLKSDNFIFVYQILKTIDYEKMNRWAVQPLITQTDLKNYVILIPSDSILQSFKEMANPIFDKIDNNNLQIQTLSKTRDELLPKLMRGEIRVKF